MIVYHCIFYKFNLYLTKYKHEGYVKEGYSQSGAFF